MGSEAGVNIESLSKGLGPNWSGRPVKRPCDPPGQETAVALTSPWEHLAPLIQSIIFQTSPSPSWIDQHLKSIFLPKYKRSIIWKTSKAKNQVSFVSFVSTSCHLPGIGTNNVSERLECTDRISIEMFFLVKLVDLILGEELLNTLLPCHSSASLMNSCWLETWSRKEGLP